MSSDFSFWLYKAGDSQPETIQSEHQNTSYKKLAMIYKHLRVMFEM
jgi:hypothetical protein